MWIATNRQQAKPRQRLSSQTATSTVAIGNVRSTSIVFSNIRIAKQILLNIPVATVGLIVTAFGFWDIWLQTKPYVQPPPLSDKMEVLPFTVTNSSHFFEMYNAKILFFVKDPAPLALNGKYHTVDFRVVTQGVDIPPLGYDTIEVLPYTFDYGMTKAEIMEKYSRISPVLVSLVVCYETTLWLGTIRRKTDPIWFQMSTSFGGQHYWTPVSHGYETALGDGSKSSDCPSAP